MNYTTELIYTLTALICSACIAFALTPAVRVLAFKINAVDVPKDNRRMHKSKMPLLGGLSIFLAFVVSVLAFCEVSKQIVALLIGALVIVVTGVADDKYNLKPIVKLVMQIVAALIIVLSGIRIEHIKIFGRLFYFGKLSIPITILWIVAMTNATNLIDGLDRLSCGVSAVSASSMLIALFFLPDTPYYAIILLSILAGSCIGFLPYNLNPAKIFMGDTGSMFLGFTLSVISIMGLFKSTAVFAFWIPFLIFIVPLGDTTFAFIRRILHGKSPFSADRGHIHHRLIDAGFSQKQVVAILCVISAIFGISAILYSVGRFKGSLLVVISAVAILLVNWRCITKNDTTKEETGIDFNKIEKNENL